jgi:hypothetical protein
VFVVVTLLVALGIAAAQGCQGPSRGLGGDGDVVRNQQERVQRQEDGLPGEAQPGYEPLRGDQMYERYDTTFELPDQRS